MNNKLQKEKLSDTIEINFHPSSHDLNQIKEWLYAEYSMSKSGFYCNWNIIVEQYNSEQMAVLEYKQTPIGFVCWAKKYGPLVFIEIVEIAAQFRSKGFGKLFIDFVLTYLAKLKYHDIAYLQCMPEESLPF